MPSNFPKPGEMRMPREKHPKVVEEATKRRRVQRIQRWAKELEKVAAVHGGRKDRRSRVIGILLRKADRGQEILSLAPLSQTWGPTTRPTSQLRGLANVGEIKRIPGDLKWL
jgi:3'-phosphoadenosine 5'-phosphosulfate sulfotransferase (PAPS reductase)/FAD synthetase